MKKYSWILALLLALAMVFVGCPSDSKDKDDDNKKEETEWTTVFNMQDSAAGTVKHGIQELEVGALTFTKDEETGNPIKPIVKAGEIPEHISSFEAVDNDGKIALKYVTVANWGPGLDLRNAVFGFKAGDKVTITGKVEKASGSIKLQYNRQEGGEYAIGEAITEEGDFTAEVELTAADVTAIQGNGQKVLRFEDRVGGTTVTIYNIVIEGERPTTITQLTAPVITLTGNDLTWDAIDGASGYEVFADGTTSVTTIAAIAEPTVALNSQAKLAIGVEYSITVKALGTTGSTTTSEASNAVTYTRPGVPSIYQVPTAGEDYFYVNLNDFATVSPEGTNIDVTPITGTLAADKITLNYTVKNQRANFKLTDAQAQTLASADTITATIVGTATPDQDFRYHLGDATLNANWNGTNAGGPGKFSEILTKDFTIESRATDSKYLSYFILQNQAEAAATVEITSIKISFTGATVVVDPLLLTLDDFTSDGKVWGFNMGSEGELDWDILVAAKYLVVEAIGDNADGVTGMQIAFQSDANDISDWHQASSKGWTTLSGADGDLIFIIDLESFPDWADLIQGTKGKLIMNNYGGTVQKAYLFDDSLELPDSVLDHSGTTTGEELTVYVMLAE